MQAYADFTNGQQTLPDGLSNYQSLYSNLASNTYPNIKLLLGVASGTGSNARAQTLTTNPGITAIFQVSCWPIFAMTLTVTTSVSALLDLPKCQASAVHHVACMCTAAATQWITHHSRD